MAFQAATEVLFTLKAPSIRTWAAGLEVSVLRLQRGDHLVRPRAGMRDVAAVGEGPGVPEKVLDHGGGIAGRFRARPSAVGEGAQEVVVPQAVLGQERVVPKVG
jgi:hypothetical protein